MFKEFLEEVVKKGFDPSLGLFKVRRVVRKKTVLWQISVAVYFQKFTLMCVIIVRSSIVLRNNIDIIDKGGGDSKLKHMIIGSDHLLTISLPVH